MKQMQRIPPVLSFVGRSGSGKTTLIEKLIPELKHQGISVGTIKRTHHQVALDIQGKDSWRHKKAGAKSTLLLGPQQFQLIAEYDSKNRDNPGFWAAQFFSEMDCVILEGGASVTGAKIEVLRHACSEKLMTPAHELLAVVSDISELDVKCPQFALNEIAEITGFVLKFLKKHEN